MTALSSDGGIPVWYWSPISDDDRTGMGWIVALMVVSLVLTASGIRMMLKRRALAVDDYILCISLFFFLAEHAALFYALHGGLGKSSETLTAVARKQVFQASFAMEVLAVTSHFISKITTAVFINQLLRGGQAVINAAICRGLIGFVSLSTIASIVILATASGEVARNEDFRMFDRWTAIVALDVLTEIAIAAVPVVLIFFILKGRTQMTAACMVFLGRLPTIAFSVLNLLHRRTLRAGPDDVGPALLFCEVLLELELAWSLVSASVPTLKSLVQPFDVVRRFQVGPGGGDDDGVKRTTRDRRDRGSRAEASFFYRGSLPEIYVPEPQVIMRKASIYQRMPEQRAALQ